MTDPTHQWRVAFPLTLLKLGGALACTVIAVVPPGDGQRLLLAGVAATGLWAYGLRDVLVPVRLTAGGEGVTVVSGYAGKRDIPWSAIERIRVDERDRFGLRTQLLEIDTGEKLFFLSRYDLGTSCEEVADTLRGLRSSAG